MQLIDAIEVETLIEPDLSENALTVIEKRYLKRDDEGNVIETPRDLFWRVAATIAQVEMTHYGAELENALRYAIDFYEMMALRKWMPNSPTLFNAGRPLGQLSACFVLPVEDCLTNGEDGIYDTLTAMASIHQSGGGTGFSFSRLRPNGSVVKSTTGVASGPVSFMSLYDSSTNVVKQGGTRRGANMGILRVDHPDIKQFIHCKADVTQITNFNISVAVTDVFMEAVKDNADYDLIHPKTGEVVGSLNAKEVFDEIVEQAHATGEPGLFFIDEANRKNPVPHLGEYEATNPCGEQPLLAYDVCNLGSTNLGAFVDESGEVDWEDLERVEHLAVRFLDNVIDANKYPLPQIRERSDAIRRIGQGVMGWADFLHLRGIAYDSTEGMMEAAYMAEWLHDIRHEASGELAEERGVFPEWEQSIWGPGNYNAPMRNCNVDTVAPTGTISIICGCSSGIEPVFAKEFKRNQAEEEMVEYDWVYSKLVKARHDTSHFREAHDISPVAHVNMQHHWQRFCDSAISKTINFPREATVEDVRACYLQAYDLKCKGITVYRDGSRPGQVLSTGETTKPTAPKPTPKAKRPDSLDGKSLKLLSPMGTLYVTINSLEDAPFEVFVMLGKAGGAATADAEAIGRLISLGLRHGVPLKEVYAQLRGISSDRAAGFGPNKVYSTPDGVAQLIGKYLGIENGSGGVEQAIANPNGVPDKVEIMPCPECGLALHYEEGCAKCHACGHSECG